ncbi:MAG: hypothetical protein M1484_00200 [Patescibacteria group bacterium]|nr:hypothetical protein [Patescibacteria group bacterium]MCL5431502.1 hypothetical protein [Patescibacteria group bacterium]
MNTPDVKPKTVKMVIYDKENPKRIIHLEAPTPGHFCYIEPAFKELYPESRGLIVQEVKEFPEEGQISEDPISTSSILMLGLINTEELAGLLLGEVPQRVQTRSPKRQRRSSRFLR